MTSPAIIYMTSGTVSPSALAVLVPLLWGANCFAKTRIRHFRAYVGFGRLRASAE
jgi:hypothetical protein